VEYCRAGHAGYNDLLVWLLCCETLAVCASNENNMEEYPYSASAKSSAATSPYSGLCERWPVPSLLYLHYTASF
jgi:hypothetical protein